MSPILHYMSVYFFNFYGKWIIWHKNQRIKIQLNSIWTLARGKLQKSSSVTPSFDLLARDMVEMLDVKELENWAMIAWLLWNARNRFHFEHVPTHPTVILREATSLVEEYQRLALVGPHFLALVSPSFVIFFLFLFFGFSCFS